MTDVESMQAELERKLADPAFKLAMEIYLGELLQQYAVYHQGQVQAIADWATGRQVDRVKSNITKRYLIDRLAEVRKSHQGPTLPRNQRPNVWDETLWERSGDGKFAGYRGTHPELVSRNWHNVNPEMKGIKTHPDSNFQHVVAANHTLRTGAERDAKHNNWGQMLPAHELQAGVSQREHVQEFNDKVHQLTWGLAQTTGDASLKQRIQYVISSPDGYTRVVTPRAGVLPAWSPETGEFVQYMTPVGPDNPVTVAGQAANIGHLAGMTPDQAAKAGAVTNDIHRALNTTDWGTKMQATANTLKVLTDNNPYAVQASAVAQLIGVLGPGGSRAFGNKLTQLSYRYLGQNVPPDAWGPAAKEGRQPDSKGNPESARNYELKLARDLVPSVPSQAQYKLALEAGSTPPSRGYLLDRRGNVINESVGYSSDWYTPFDLRHLPRVRGGSYVRTRGFGGITPEDLRLAMRAGVNRVTVVSNNGVFTIEFNPKAMHFGHRYGYAGNSMIRRYAKALDAIRGDEVKLEDGPMAATGAKMKLDTDGYLAAMRDLQMRNPYFIKEDSAATPMYQEMRDFGFVRRNEATGNTAHDLGYMGPLDLYPKLARGGWKDNVAREVWTDKNGKFAYSDDAKAVLMHDRLMGTSSKLRVTVDANGRATQTRSGGTGAGSSFYVDSQNIRRNSAGDPVNTRGETISEQQARVLRSELRAAGRSDLLRPGNYGDTATHRDGIVYRQAHVGEAAADPGRVSYNDERANAGAVSYSSPYTPDPDEVHMDGNDALAAAEDVRQLMKMYKDKRLMPRNIDTYDYAGEANRALFPNGGGDPDGTPAYADFVEKVRTSQSFREGLQQELAEILNGRSLGRRVTVVPSEVFASLRREDYETQEGRQPFDPPTEATGDPEHPVTYAELMDSPDIEQWLDEQKRLAQHGDGTAQRAARDNLRDLNYYRAVIKRATEGRQSSSGQLPSIDDFIRTDEELKAYRRLNDHLAGVIKHGYQFDYDAGIESQPDLVPDLGTHTPVNAPAPTGGRGVARQDIEAGMSPTDVANTHYVDLRNNEPGLATHEVAGRMRSRAGQYEAFARHRQGRDDQEQYLQVAAELRRLAHEQPDPNEPR